MKNLIRFDWAVKRLLRNKANFGILEGFLSELLCEDIKIDSILESEGNRQVSDDKTNRVDILVQNFKDELIIIEIQNNYLTDYLLRMNYGTSKLITDNMVAGMPYSMVKKIISINIVYFDLGKGEDYIYHGTTNFIGLHKKDILKLSITEQDIYHTEEIAKIFPEYYIIKVNQFDDVSKNTLDEWINFFKNQEVKDDTKAKGLFEAQKELNVMKLTTPERQEYEAYIKDWRDNYAAIVGNYDKGRIEGRKEGLEKGKIEGRKEGVEKGKNERTVEIVTNMNKKGFSNQVISEITGFTIAEIKKIIEEID